MEQQLIVFKIAQEHYGIDIDAINNIVQLLPITVLPHTPEFSEGVINLRGEVLAVMNLHKRFGFATAAVKGTHILIVNLEQTRVGLIVDAVVGVLQINSAQIVPPPSLVISAKSAFVIGIAKTKLGLVILIDPQELLSGTEQTALLKLQREKAKLHD